MCNLICSHCFTTEYCFIVITSLLLHVCSEIAEELRPFHIDTRFEFNAHWLCLHLKSFLGQCELNAQWTNPPLEADWNRIRTEFIVYSSNNNNFMHSYTSMNSNIVNAFASRLPYKLYLLSKIRTMMAYHAGMLLTRCC